MTGRREDSADRRGVGVAQDPPDFECLDAGTSGGEPSGENTVRPLALLGYLLAGTFLGFVFVMSEVVSWYRIQEMFRFQSFHMYGIIGSAVAVAALSVEIIKRTGARSASGQPIRLAPKEWGTSRIPAARYWIGGGLFGMGWALLGACPGPIFALLGSGITVMVVALVSAMAGTWAYASLRGRLPH